MQRADQLLARSWARACRRVVQTEGFLEDALAAALEVPDFWSRFVDRVGLAEKVPQELPQVSTQDRVDEGRADIILSWPNGYRLALELKTDDPPGAAQIEQYLRSGLDVIAIAKLAADVRVEVPAARRYFGVITWTRIREVHWSGAPLEVWQLHKLLDATEVVMPKITHSMLEGMLVSWNTWDTLQAWTRKGLDATQAVLGRAGLKCVQPGESPQIFRGIHMKTGRREEESLGNLLAFPPSCSISRWNRPRNEGICQAPNRTRRANT